MIKVRLIAPAVTEGLRLDDHIQAMSNDTVQVSMSMLRKGPASIEGEYDEALAVPDSVNRALEAERDGIDALVLDCMGDPGLGAIREAVSIPVLGAAQTSMHLASMLGHRFSIITVLRNLHALLEGLARKYGLEKMARVRSVGIPVLELDKDIDRLTAAFVEQSRRAVEDDESDVIIFGCTGMFGMVERVQQGLFKAGIQDIPIIDPTPTAVQIAAGVVNAGLTHTKCIYPFPREKNICGFDLEPITREEKKVTRKAG